MTLHIDKAETVLGLPLMTIREVLRTWRHKNSDVFKIVEYASINIPEWIIIAILQDAKDRGWIGTEYTDTGIKDGLTALGEAICMATGKSRMAKAKAWQLTNNVVDRIAEVNADQAIPLEFMQVWVFGSLIDDRKSDVGDVDIVFTAKTRKEKTSWYQFLIDLKGSTGLQHPNGIWSPWDVAWVANKLVFGKRRNSIFAVNDLQTLMKLHRPCQLLFDHDRGGRVHDPALPHHPDSVARSHDVGEPLRLPKFQASSSVPRPSSSRWLEGNRFQPYAIHPLSFHNIEDALSSTGYWSGGEDEAYHLKVFDKLAALSKEVGNERARLFKTPDGTTSVGIVPVKWGTSETANFGFNLERKSSFVCGILKLQVFLSVIGDDCAALPRSVSRHLRGFIVMMMMSDLLRTLHCVPFGVSEPLVNVEVMIPFSEPLSSDFRRGLINALEDDTTLASFTEEQRRRIEINVNGEEIIARSSSTEGEKYSSEKR
jgi:hypothetical protein